MTRDTSLISIPRPATSVATMMSLVPPFKLARAYSLCSWPLPPCNVVALYCEQREKSWSIPKQNYICWPGKYSLRSWPFNVVALYRQQKESHDQSWNKLNTLARKVLSPLQTFHCRGIVLSTEREPWSILKQTKYAGQESTLSTPDLSLSWHCTVNRKRAMINPETNYIRWPEKLLSLLVTFQCCGIVLSTWKKAMINPKANYIYWPGCTVLPLLLTRLSFSNFYAS